MAEDLFALDIGTRSVIGLVYQPASQRAIRLRSYEIKEHEIRSMYDGQIHDIEQVAGVVQQVKKTLEKRLAIKLERAAIAAAGRALETENNYHQIQRDSKTRIDPEEIYALELEAVQRAEQNLLQRMQYKDLEDPHYYCVAHSVIRYTLNGYPINNLIGQKGDKIGVEVIATFLPQVVVDSLEGVIEQVGLTIDSLTLEPIAAINLAIPSEIRMLNLALVDIGAGTSDIAITSEGTVAAYQMVPYAGDEITDKICKTLLVDFHTGEKIKFLLSQHKQKLSYQDVLGNKYNITSKEVAHIVQKEIDALAKKVSTAITQVNGGSPSAVFCVGGGSQLPGLEQKLAEELQVDKDKVTIKGGEKWPQVKNMRKGLQNPRSVTPLGIALTSVQDKTFGFIDVTVNDKMVRLFERGKTTVAEALVAARYPMKNLIPRPGKGLTLWLNGEEKYFTGGESRTAEIYINDERANLQQEIKSGDVITVYSASQGEKRKVKLSQVLADYQRPVFYLNGEKVYFPIEVLVDGEPVQLPEQEDLLIEKECEISVMPTTRVKDLMHALEIDQNSYHLYISDHGTREGKVLEETDKIPLNGNLDLVTCKKSKHRPNPTNKTNGEAASAKDKEIYAAPTEITVMVNGDSVTLPAGHRHKLLNIFSLLNFDTHTQKGKLIMTINGAEAEFTDPIKHGDTIMLYWSEEGPKSLPRLEEE